MKSLIPERVLLLQPYGRCHWCGCRSFYSPYVGDPFGPEVGWDVVLCLVCDVFLEGACGCWICSNRPERPSNLRLRRVITDGAWPPLERKLPPTRRSLELQEDDDG